MRVGVHIAVEGRIDAAVAGRLLKEAGLEAEEVYLRRGKSDLDPRIPGYARAAAYWPWLTLRDLDQDAPCPPALLAKLVPDQPTYLCFRVPVPQVESWLMADAAGLADLLSVRRSQVPDSPDLVGDAKEALLNLAAKSRSSLIKRELLPRAGSGGRVGPLYNDTLSRFASHSWDVAAACEASESLARSFEAIRAITFPK